MSLMEYDAVRRYSPHSHSYSNYYSRDRNTSLGHAHSTRVDPRGYQLSSPLGAAGMRARAGFRQDEHHVENGQSRRRIAIACARCRKRKIRCSGDPGTAGVGCSNCKSAGVDLSQCQFHRVGSDNVHKVIDNIAIAQSLTRLANSSNMRPTYSQQSSGSLYSRPVTTDFPQLDSKPVYSPAWASAYPEDTSPVENYNFDPQGSYLPMPNLVTGHNMYGSSFRWPHPTMRASAPGANGYFAPDSSYNSTTLQYMQPTSRGTTSEEPLSSLDMSSLRLMLPERPHPRQYMAEAPGPSRQILPVPQPNSTQMSRNAVDQLQDQRLRSVHITNTQTAGTNGADTKHLMPWSNDDNTSICLPGTTAAENSAQLSINTYLGEAASSTEELPKSNATGLSQINFSNSSLLDVMNTPLPPTIYSNFRENRLQCSSPTNTSRRDSQANLYSFSAETDTKRQTNSEESSTDGTLVSGHRYVPLSLDMPQVHEDKREPKTKDFEHSSVPLERTSKGKLRSSF